LRERRLPPFPSQGRRASATKLLEGRANSEEESMLLSENELRGTVVEITKGLTTSNVRINVNGIRIIASITNDAVNELRLTKGMVVYAIIKASDVMVGTDCPVEFD
jgi:molybdopterin-binding protein